MFNIFGNNEDKKENQETKMAQYKCSKENGKITLQGHFTKSDERTIFHPGTDNTLFIKSHLGELVKLIEHMGGECLVVGSTVLDLEKGTIVNEEEFSWHGYFEDPLAVLNGEASRTLDISEDILGLDDPKNLHFDEQCRLKEVLENGTDTLVGEMVEVQDVDTNG